MFEYSNFRFFFVPKQLKFVLRKHFVGDDYQETVPGGNGTWRTSQCWRYHRTTSAIISDFKIAFQHLLSWGLLLSKRRIENGSVENGIIAFLENGVKQ
ncbi:unnamed protein product [Brugia timori]|uniref:Uncharacterized protein n=1 Tax=Brugia timori TaxID=42155 RepID=A0A0R3QRZ0_9BILA|nr:unnamed protein product [Brugia timori]